MAVNEDRRRRIEESIREKNLSGASRLILQECRRYPNDPWLLTRLCWTYAQEGNDRKVLEISAKAFGGAPENPITLWDYAGALYRVGRLIESMGIYRKVLRKKVSVIAKSVYWSEVEARVCQNACRYEIALCYIRLNRLGRAIRQLEGYLRHRDGRGKDYYPVRMAGEKLKKLRVFKKRIEMGEPGTWISLLEVQETKGRRRTKYWRGFTNGLVVAKSAVDAVRLFAQELSVQGYKLIGTEGTEELERRLLTSEVGQDLKKLGARAKMKKRAQFGDFFVYRRRG